MAAVTKDEREIRVGHMKMLGQWLKDNGRTQRWAANQLGIYHGYLSNLVTGKQVASEDICRKAGKLMGPLDVETGKPYGPAWTDRELRDKRDEERRKRAERAEKKAKQVKKKKVVKKKVAKKRTRIARPEDLPFDVSPVPTRVKRTVDKLARKSKITSWEPPARHSWSLVTFEEIEAHRVDLGISKAAMAGLLEVTNSTYHNWRRGQSVPPRHRQERIKRVLANPLSKSHPRFSQLGPKEKDAAIGVIVTCIHTMPPMTCDRLIQVIDAVVAGFAEPYQP